MEGDSGRPMLHLGAKGLYIEVARKYEFYVRVARAIARHRDENFQRISKSKKRNEPRLNDMHVVVFLFCFHCIYK